MSTISISYKKNEIEEHLVALYLRLNHYFTSGFIIHSENKGDIRTQVDILATHFPLAREPERKVGTCPKLSVPTNCVDFIICEVKNENQQPILFNPPIFDIDNIKCVLRRIGAFTEQEVIIVAEQLREQLVNKRDGIPCVEWLQADKSKSGNPLCQVRLILFDLYKDNSDDPRCIYGKAVIDYIWDCLRTEVRPEHCNRRYGWEQWGALFRPMIQYFKQIKQSPRNTDEVLDQLKLIVSQMYHG